MPFPMSAAFCFSSRAVRLPDTPAFIPGSYWLTDAWRNTSRPVRFSHATPGAHAAHAGNVADGVLGAGCRDAGRGLASPPRTGYLSFSWMDVDRTVYSQANSKCELHQNPPGDESRDISVLPGHPLPVTRISPGTALSEAVMGRRELTPASVRLAPRHGHAFAGTSLGRRTPPDGVRTLIFPARSRPAGLRAHHLSWSDPGAWISVPAKESPGGHIGNAEGLGQGRQP